MKNVEENAIKSAREVIEEAMQVLESGAAYNRSKGRTVFAHAQQDRADRLRALLGATSVGGAVRDALQFIHDTFKRDLDGGYKTRDKEFAVEIAASALREHMGGALVDKSDHHISTEGLDLVSLGLREAPTESAAAPAEQADFEQVAIYIANKIVPEVGKNVSGNGVVSFARAVLKASSKPVAWNVSYDGGENWTVYEWNPTGKVGPDALIRPLIEFDPTPTPAGEVEQGEKS